MIKKILNLDNIYFILAWLVPLIFYWQAVAPTVQLEDSAELTTAVLTWGIPHPSGYPLYVLLARSWSSLIGLTPWAVNLFSIGCAVLALAFVYKAARWWGAGSIGSLVATWLLAGWPAFWSQTIVAEVYSLHVLLLAMIIYLAARFKQSGSSYLVYVTSLLAGLAAGNHLLIIWLWPILVVYYYKFWTMIDLAGRLRLLGVFFLASLVYLYLPWRAAQNPLLNWGQADNWFSFWHHVLRLGYNDIGWSALTGFKAGLIGSFILDLLTGFGWPILLILFLGLVVGYKTYGKTIIFLLAVVVSQILPAVFLRQYGWGLGVAFTYSVYWSGAILALAILVAVAIKALEEWLVKNNSLSKKQFQVWLAVIIILSLPVVSWYNNFWQLNYQADYWPEVYAEKLLSGLAPQAILFIWGEDYANDSLLFTIAYQKLVKRTRPDVTVVDGQIIFPFQLPNEAKDETDYWLNLWRYAYLTNRPLYGTRLPPNDIFLIGRQDSYAYRIFASLDQANQADLAVWLLPPEIWTQPRLLYYSGQDYLAHLLYGQALALWQLGRPQPAQAFLQEAIYLDNELFSKDYWRFVKQREYLNQLK
ncbi:DUF2723 domain-containing protein [Patescibacteria group bacterium]|nr:DUF2723 domain-containing protein [Patescibacteria group bacterium]